MKKLLLLFIISATFIAGCSFSIVSPSGSNTESSSSPKQEAENLPEEAFATEVESILDEKLNILKQVAADELIVKSVTDSNEENKIPDQNKIEDIDKKWQRNEPSIKPLLTKLLTNDIALALVRIEENYPGFTTLFITDKNGLVVATTIKTLSYQHSDEYWWQQCIVENKGIASYSGFQYDLSTHAEGVSFYVPIKDQGGQAIGCMKAFFDIAAIYHDILED